MGGYGENISIWYETSLVYLEILSQTREQRITGKYVNPIYIYSSRPLPPSNESTVAVNLMVYLDEQQKLISLSNV
jgi:hypothetical protein